MIGLIAAALDLAGLRQRLLDSAAAADPATDQELLREGVDTTVLAVVGPLAVLTVLGLAALLLYLRRRSIWSRVLLVLGLLTVAADVLAHDLLAGGPDVDRSAVLVQAGLVTVGLALLFLPRPSRDWSREPRG
ncbi:hypothetical protein O2W18_17900 [Modestobacter sp. VKM Ac-2983]|uniref:hypothetical protein n=1 Tax=Modestobacter sp. VKM Ac-2983 TaxID=3004137 RepID=UPI0022AB62B6|nr:hypothetical protein [Modestobacter sp. VKM Ac-2983]MCZ2806983.1 hypothetical protein [Modestobacter sp. VKM Ac-2983]